MANDASVRPRPSRQLAYVAFVVILVLAVGVRILGAFNDLWLDEIWSLGLVQQVSSPWGIFTRIHQDTNQYLNSLFIYVLGSHHGNWPGYRVPSLFAGAGTIILAWLIGRRRSVACAFFAMLLVSFSYVMVLYSSEARGYAWLVFCSYFVFYVLELHLEKPRWVTACLINLGETMGFLSHYLFFCFFCVVLGWSAYRFTKSNPEFKRVFTSLLACHALPFIVFGWLYIVDIRLITSGGGMERNVWSVFADSLAWTLGHPVGIPLLITVPVVVAICGAGLWILGRERLDLLVLFAGIVLFPIPVILVKHFEFIYVRHFLVGMAFLLIPVSYLLACLYQKTTWGKWFCFLFLSGYFLANGLHLMTLFRDGRGHYNDAIRYMITHTNGDHTSIGSDQDFRTLLVLRFYVGEMPGNVKVGYYSQNEWPPAGSEFFISDEESFNSATPPDTQFTDQSGNKYELVKIFPTAPLSGLHWFIYHNTAK